MRKEELIQKEAEELYNHYLSKPQKWRHRHNQYNNIKKCIDIVKKRYGMEVEAVKRVEQVVELQPNKKTGFKFYEYKMEDRYTTYRTYLEERCKMLPDQIERKFKNSSVRHIASKCRGMSNYIQIIRIDAEDEENDTITIRISDHEPTGSGSECDFYMYIQDKTWMEIKKRVFEIAEEFLK